MPDTIDNFIEGDKNKGNEISKQIKEVARNLGYLIPPERFGESANENGEKILNEDYFFSGSDFELHSITMHRKQEKINIELLRYRGKQVFHSFNEKINVYQSGTWEEILSNLYCVVLQN